MVGWKIELYRKCVELATWIPRQLPLVLQRFFFLQYKYEWQLLVLWNLSRASAEPLSLLEHFSVDKK